MPNSNNNSNNTKLLPWQFLVYLSMIALVVFQLINPTGILQQFNIKLEPYDYFAVGVMMSAVGYLAWKWKRFSLIGVATGGLTLSAISIYQKYLVLNSNANTFESTEQLMTVAQEKSFFLKYILSSQTSIIWMVVLFGLSLISYLLALKFDKQQKNLVKWAYGLSVSALVMGLTGLMVRWFESYGYNAQMGHIPISNLYESVLLLVLISSGLHLYFEEKHNTPHLGAFAVLSINIANGFLLWYAMTRNANQITALVPALQSWWMKIHVPANFIGYGAFSLSAMFGIAVFIKLYFPKSPLPAISIIGEMMYQLIAMGFAFFTLATVLGAMWAADAWGTYWQWDPKETWALIVWINYAAWLHFRLMYRLEEELLALWAIIGYFITLFAYLGVNMFLSGLHSYGQL